MDDLLDLSWLVLVAPAVTTALVIRADAKLIGPYWSFMELIPGLGSIDADLWYERPPLIQAILRRYAYVIVASAIMTASVSTWGAAESGLLGTAIVGLLLWPIVFHGLPYGVLRRDWQLVPVYAGAVLSFISTAVLGYFVWGYIVAQADGDPRRWIRDHLANALFWSGVGIIGTAFYQGGLRRLRAASRARADGEGGGQDA